MFHCQWRINLALFEKRMDGNAQLSWNYHPEDIGVKKYQIMSCGLNAAE